MLTLKNRDSDIWISTQFTTQEALKATTHLAIGAHQDDLEFMAYEGIAACYQKSDLWFTGITVTDGRGSSRVGPYSNISDDKMREIRREEQRRAAEVGDYAAQFQLDYQSSAVKGPDRDKVTEDIAAILQQMRPDTVYLHQPADKHDTHIAVLTASIAALRQTADHHRPQKVVGCEMWRSLDWLDDSAKVLLDCSLHPELFEQLTAVYDSQISGGKRYDHAIVGRQRANATFFDSHSPDQSELLTWGIDLTPLVQDFSLSLSDFIQNHLDQLTQDVVQRIQKYT